jgi:hypothetical protein
MIEFFRDIKGIFWDSVPKVMYALLLIWWIVFGLIILGIIELIKWIF